MDSSSSLNRNDNDVAHWEGDYSYCTPGSTNELVDFHPDQEPPSPTETLPRYTRAPDYFSAANVRSLQEAPPRSLPTLPQSPATPETTQYQASQPHQSHNPQSRGPMRNLPSLPQSQPSQQPILPSSQDVRPPQLQPSQLQNDLPPPHIMQPTPTIPPRVSHVTAPRDVKPSQSQNQHQSGNPRSPLTSQFVPVRRLALTGHDEYGSRGGLLQPPATASHLEPKETSSLSRSFSNMFKKSKSTVSPFMDAGPKPCSPLLYTFRRENGPERGNKYIQYDTSSANEKHFVKSNLLDEGGYHTLPLWNPPKSERVDSLTKKSHETSVTDIAFVDRNTGLCHSLFNIFKSEKENLDEGMHPPPGHQPLPEKYLRLLKTRYIDTQCAIGLNQDIEVSRPHERKFVSSPGSNGGTIVAFPCGSKPYRVFMAREFFRKDEVKFYFINNVVNWYFHAMANWGEHQFFNGSLCFIEHVVHADAWAAASFYNFPPLEHRLKLCDSNSSCSWESSVGAPNILTATHVPGDGRSPLIAIGTNEIYVDGQSWDKYMQGKPSSPPKSTEKAPDLWQKSAKGTSILSGSIRLRSNKKLSINNLTPEAISAYKMLIIQVDPPPEK